MGTILGTSQGSEVEENSPRPTQIKATTKSDRNLYLIFPPGKGKGSFWAHENNDKRCPARLCVCLLQLTASSVEIQWGEKKR